ncbi:MAG TPA: glutathione S-transferase family protein [Luteibacter sp.]|jgi:glutathione S-transferase|nr:glutathione S-transferase family protein [Luteibacter sp.]
MYTLYYSPGTASMVVHLALLEIGAPHRLVLVDFDRDAQHDEAYLALNPLGRVPVLLVDGEPVTESAALLLLLAERHPEAGLAPAPGSPGRGAWLQWVVYLANTVTATYRAWFYPDYRDMPDHPPEARESLQRQIEAAWDLLDAHLVANGPYMLGETFSGLDLQLTMLMRWSRKMPRQATEWPALKALADRIRARPSWKKLYEIEGLAEWY